MAHVPFCFLLCPRSLFIQQSLSTGVQGSAGRAQAPHGWATETEIVVVSRLTDGAPAPSGVLTCVPAWAGGWRLSGSRLAQVLQQTLQSLHTREHILLQPLLYGVGVEGQLQGRLQLLHEAVPPA